MEDNQITQPETSQSNTTKPDQSSRWQNCANSNFLLDLISRRAWLLWLGVAGFLFTIIYISLSSITQAGFVNEPKAVVTKNPETQTDTLPLWLFSVGIIAGAAGAVATLYLPSSPFHLATTKPFSRRQKGLQQQMLLPPVSDVTETITIPSVPLPEQPPELSEQTISEENILVVLQLLADEESEELLTVEEIVLSDEQTDFIPAPENQCLATSTQSLVEMLDLRSQIPLSSILGESFPRSN